MRPSTRSIVRDRHRRPHAQARHVPRAMGHGHRDWADRGPQGVGAEGRGLGGVDGRPSAPRAVVRQAQARWNIWADPEPLERAVELALEAFGLADAHDVRTQSYALRSEER